MKNFISIKTASASAERPKILIIDDSTVDLQLLLAMMSSRNMRISVAFNGREGYEKALLQQPDLILLDVVMSKMDGMTTCRLLKSHQETRDIPVIFLSAKSELDQRLQGLALGAVDFISKPFSEAEVIAKAQIHLALLRRIQAQQSRRSEDLTPADEAKLPQKDALLLRRTTDYLHQHLRRPPSTELLAHHFGTNEKRLNQVFQARFELPVFGWIRQERLRQARDLVVNTENSLLSIADHLGYCSAANFSTAFKQYYSCTPSELRKQQREDDANISIS
jgi:YesN/AraC family two-component response regulator